jgi:ribosomal protein S18 acetylase RimI-like enzyme
MSEIIISNLKHISFAGNDVVIKQQLSEIFFESSSKKDFLNQEDKDKFFWKYMGFYLTHYPEFTFIAHADFKVLGYILGMPFSHDPSLYEIQPHMKTFEEEFQEYPGNLHINCHVDSRGMGLGEKLITQFEEFLKVNGCLGYHAMTGPESRNKSFYKKLGFEFEKEKNGILLLGKKIIS